MKHIVYVCTGNVFRSPSAERLAQHYCLEHGITDFQFSSAGIDVLSNNTFHALTIRALHKYGVNTDYHFPRQLNYDIVRSADLLVPMGFDHQVWISRFCSIETPLFNLLAYKKNEPLLDLHELPENFPIRKRDYIEHVITYIHDGMPSFVDNIPRFLR